MTVVQAMGLVFIVAAVPTLLACAVAADKSDNEFAPLFTLLGWVATFMGFGGVAMMMFG